MNDDDELVQPDRHDGDLLLYDFFKHLTSLSILVLGGVLIVAQASDPADVKRWLVIAVLLLVSAAGVMSFSGSAEIVRARSTGTPLNRTPSWARKVAPALLAMGVGMFLSTYTDALN